MKPILSPTCVKAWSEAAKHLISQRNRRDYMLILEIENGMNLPPEDKLAADNVESFLRDRANLGLNTVINTIFPASLYASEGRSGVFSKFNELWPTIKPTNQWGTYAERMLTFDSSSGKNASPLERLLEKLTRAVQTINPKHAAYELNLVDLFADLPLYSFEKDANLTRGLPCLSHLSFKLKDDNRLMLIAFYRSHYYVERALGNLFGLAWLQHFVAKEAKTDVAELVCISSMAQLETKPMSETTKGWGVGEITALIDRCRCHVSQTKVPS
jgi:hypothetical protein